MVKLEELTKLYYSIGEVAELFDVAPSLIRYWEAEFKTLSPGKNSKGDRKFTQKDIATLNTIYHLVKERGFTIEGANKELEEIKNSVKEDDALRKELKQKLTNLKSKLVSLRDSI